MRFCLDFCLGAMDLIDLIGSNKSRNVPMEESSKEITVFFAPRTLAILSTTIWSVQCTSDISGAYGECTRWSR